MGERKVTSFPQIMKILLENPDEERSKFCRENPRAIRSVIIIASRMLVNDDKNEQFASLKFLGKISEVESKGIVDYLVEDAEVLEALMSPMVPVILFGGKMERNEKKFEAVKDRLSLLINLTRSAVHEKIIDRLLLHDSSRSYVQGLQTAVSSLNKTRSLEGETVMTTLLIQLLLNLSKSPLLFTEGEKDRSSFSKLVTDVFKLFENSADPKVRSFSLSMLVNFLISGLAQETLLNPELDLVTKILFPLTGPTEIEFDEEDMAKLPIELQYLPPDKKREADQSTISNLISCLLLCCNTQQGREYLKSKGTYYILREFHKLQPDRPIQKRVEDVIDILIKDEQEYDLYPDLLNTAIPENLICKFNEMDEELEKD